MWLEAALRPLPWESINKESDLKLGYTIIYVPDVPASLRFFANAFGMKRRFLHESGTYGELDTGETTLSFAAHELGDMNFPGGHVHADTSGQPLGKFMSRSSPMTWQWRMPRRSPLAQKKWRPRL